MTAAKGASEVKKIVRQLETRAKRLAGQRDKLRELLGEIEALADSVERGCDDLDEAISALDRACDALSELV